MLVEKNVSIIDDNNNINNIIKEKRVCLTTSIFIFSLFLSFIIDLYNLNPLIANASIAGINKIFCISNKIRTNTVPCCNPIILIQTAMVYPKQKPRYKTTPNTTGNPITVVPKNHKTIAKTIFCPILFFNNSIWFKFSVPFIFSIKPLKYVVTSCFCGSCILLTKKTPKKIPIININDIIAYSFLLFKTCSFITSKNFIRLFLFIKFLLIFIPNVYSIRIFLEQVTLLKIFTL